MRIMGIIIWHGIIMLWYIVIISIMSIACGCVYLGYAEHAHNTMQRIARKQPDYRVRILDQTDANLVKRFLPPQMLADLANQLVDHPESRDDSIVLNLDTGNHGKELPWDPEVDHCQVLEHTDRDLYKNIQDTETIVFY